MTLLSHASIIDYVQSLLGGDTDIFTDAIITTRITEALPEFSRYSPFIVREELYTTDDSKEIDITSISNLLWVQDLEFRTSQDPREWRNFTERYRNNISMEIDFYPDDTDSGIDTDEALDASETGVDVDADATSAIPVGTVIKVDSELMYVTATGTSLTVVRGYANSSTSTHDTDSDIYIPEKAYLYVAKIHQIPPLTDLAGEVDLGAGYTAGTRTIHIDGMGASDTLYKDYLFTLENDGSGTVYRLTEDTTLSSNEGDITFTPGLAEDIADGDDITFKNSTLTPAIESLFIDYVAARTAMGISAKFIERVNKGGGNVFSEFRQWGIDQLSLVTSKLQKEAVKYRKPYKILPRV